MSATGPLGCGDKWLLDSDGCDCPDHIPDDFLAGDMPTLDCEPQAAAMARCAAAHPACYKLTDGKQVMSWKDSSQDTTSLNAPPDPCLPELHALNVCSTTHSASNLQTFVPWGAKGLNFLSAAEACNNCLALCNTEQLACLNDIVCWQVQKCGGRAGQDCSSIYPAGKPKYDAWTGCAAAKCSAACVPGSSSGAGGSGSVPGGGKCTTGSASCIDPGYCSPSMSHCACGTTCVHYGAGEYMCGATCSTDADCSSKTNPTTGKCYATCTPGLETPTMFYDGFCN